MVDIIDYGAFSVNALGQYSSNPHHVMKQEASALGYLTDICLDKYGVAIYDTDGTEPDPRYKRDATVAEKLLLRDNVRSLSLSDAADATFGPSLRAIWNRNVFYPVTAPFVLTAEHIHKRNIQKSINSALISEGRDPMFDLGPMNRLHMMWKGSVLDCALEAIDYHRKHSKGLGDTVEEYKSLRKFYADKDETANEPVGP
ncbi:MAG: hypothetical protein LRY76_01605 [Alphaproteobacteria bacterium]|nr:hypothetical protein [Alphaproteobacteria bacterium]